MIYVYICIPHIFIGIGTTHTCMDICCIHVYWAKIGSTIKNDLKSGIGTVLGSFRMIHTLP